MSSLTSQELSFSEMGVCIQVGLSKFNKAITHDSDFMWLILQATKEDNYSSDE